MEKDVRNDGKLEHGMLLDGKYVMDDAMPFLRKRLEKMVPQELHNALREMLELFESELASADVSDRFEEIQ